MHLEKVAVFFPFVLSLNLGPGVKGVGEVGADGLLQPVNVFHAVVGILLVVDVVKLVKVLFVLAHVRKGPLEKKDSSPMFRIPPRKISVSFIVEFFCILKFWFHLSKK